MHYLSLTIAFLACCSLAGCGEVSSAFVSSQISTLTSFPPSGIYAISTFVSTGHGRLSASKSQASVGQTITITATPEPGFALESISSEETALTTVSEGEAYAFAMPPMNVIVTASFILQEPSSSGNLGICAF